MIDLTTTYWDLVLSFSKDEGVDEEGLRKLRSAQILRSLASKDDFTKAAGEVSQNIGSLAKYLDENRSNYVQMGRLTDAERDQIEQQIGAFSKTCSSNVEKLQTMVDRIFKGASTPNSNILAHRQGMVLILSERLASLTSTFDGLRAVRYRQLVRSEAAKRRRTPTQKMRKIQKSVRDRGYNEERGLDQQLSDQQVVVDKENEILQAELLRSVSDVEYAERTVREIATLNQMFSTAILHQSHQIESLYNQAVAVTGTLGSANVQLDKAVRTNRSSQRCMFLLLIFASLGILFLDWWYS